MLAFLAVSFAVSAVTAQYGSNTANDATANRPTYSNGPIYYPPVVFDSHYYWDYDSREHHHKSCPRIQTYLPVLPGIPEEAFYPPVIRYAKFGRTLTALIVCDRDPKNLNVLFVRRNESRDTRSAHFAAAGTTAAITATCDRRERRFVGPVLNFTETATFSSNVRVLEVACLGLDKVPIVGLKVDKSIQVAGRLFASSMADGEILSRKKREAVEETTTAAAVETTEATEAATTEAAATTAADAATEAATDASAVTSSGASIASIDLSDGVSKEEAALVKDPQTAVQVILGNLGNILGTVF